MNICSKLKNIFCKQKQEKPIEVVKEQQDVKNKREHIELVKPLVLKDGVHDEEYKYESSLWFPYRNDDGTYTVVADTNNYYCEIKGFTKLDLLRIWSVLSNFAEIHGEEYNKEHNLV